MVEHRTRLATASGYITAHSSACMPPMDPPTTACQRSMPSPTARLCWARTMSRTVTTGNELPCGRPVAGSVEEGPVEPWQPPSTLEQTTNQRSVST